MHLYDFIINEDNKQKALDFINTVIDNHDWEKFILSIRRIKGSQKSVGFYINNEPITFLNKNGKPSTEFINISKKIRHACNNKVEETLAKLATKNKNESDFIIKTLIPGLIDPYELTSKQNKNNKVSNPSHYKDIGIALVYRSSEFVSKMANSKTKINPTIFNQLMIDAFNDPSSNEGSNENFLMQFTNINQKIELDAAKKTVEQVETNGNNETDAEQQLGKKESFLINSIENMIFESNIALPRSIADFSNNIKTAQKQVELVKNAWPAQYKTWLDKYNAAFNDGIKQGQDDVRKNDNAILKDPLTGKELKGRKGLGTGGPNAFIRDHEYINKLCSNIKNQKPTTIFNIGPKMVLGLFDMLEHGGKIIQGIKDEFGTAINDIKKSLSSTTAYKNFNNKIDELIENNQYAEAAGVAKASAVVEFDQLITLLQNGPIGKINFKNNTFSTEMNNSQTSIEVAIQNLLASLDKYTDTEKRFEENKNININSHQTDSVILDKNSSDNNNENDNDVEKEDESINKHTLKNFIFEINNKLVEDKSESNDESKAISNIDAQNSILSQLEMIKDNFDQTIDKERLKTVVNMLNKFKNIDKHNIKTDNGKTPDFSSLDKIINLYNMLINDDLKFKMDSVDLKTFLDGIKSYINDFKSIPEIKELPIYIDPNDKSWPAVTTEGELKKVISGEDNGKNFAIETEKLQNELIEKHIKTLNSSAKESTGDAWITLYKNRLNDLKTRAENYIQKIKNTYKDNTPEWLDNYANEMINGVQYLSQLYMLMTLMTKYRKQLNGSDDNKEIEESINISKTNTLNEESDKIDSAKNGPTEENHGQKAMMQKPGKTQKHDINTLGKLLENIDINVSLLGTDWDAEEYIKNDLTSIGKYIKSFANRASAFGADHPNEGNGIIPTIIDLIARDTPEAKENLNKIKSTCAKMVKPYIEAIEGQRDFKQMDLYYCLGSAWGIYHSLTHNTVKQTTDEATIISFTNDHKKSVLNELYKYIRG